MEIFCRIREIQKAALKVEAAVEERYGICFNEGVLLCMLNREGCCSSGNLSEMLQLSSSNTSKVLRSVEEKGLVKRVMGESDRRKMYFSITEKGQDLLGRISCRNLEIPEILSGLCCGTDRG